IRRPGVAIPPAVTAVVDLSMTPERLRAVIEAVLTGDPAALAATLEPQLSSREREVMTLLAAGWRDRSIAQQLHISESTVKFHINNSLTKLNAKNRYQGVYQAAIQGCI
ncbi:MAG: LuxR C-terminal-related transcriptional regulator, partial [Cyanobacteria bacterium]|nr:LuxR C-terminal-related transcriptional regulator [Cyanobacteriota bacterium]